MDGLFHGKSQRNSWMMTGVPPFISIYSISFFLADGEIQVVVVVVVVVVGFCMEEKTALVRAIFSVHPTTF